MKLNSIHKVDMTHGPLGKKILVFALTVAATNILQQLFNAADVAVVGHFVGSDALAAVGATSSLTNLFLNLFLGLSLGANVITARLIGMEDKEGVKRAVPTAMLIAVFSGIILMFVGVFFTESILKMMSMPENILPMSALYIKIYFLGSPLLLIYNFGSALLRSVGDTRRPLIGLACAGVLNVILNIIFICVIGMGVEGVAIATVTANILSSGLVLYFLTRKECETRLDFKAICFDKKIAMKIASVGIPAGVQQMVFSMSNICVQSCLNRLGSAAMAASAAALNFEMITFFLENGFTQATTTFVSQNRGANKPERCRRAYKLALIMGMSISFSAAIIFTVFARPLLKIFVTELAVIELAVWRMYLAVATNFLNALQDITAGAIRGMGHSVAPAIVAMFGICGFRILYIFTVYKSIEGFNALIMVYPLSWIITSIIMIILYRKVRV